MNHFQQPPHVAQQSRREKLRIPGSLHPSSPQSGNHSDQSAGSASVLEARQGAPDVQQPDNFNASSGGVRGYPGQTSINDVLPSVYNQNVISSDPYNFPAGSELLAYTAKPNGYIGAPGSDLLPPQTPLAGFSNQAGVISKNWSGMNGQLGHYNGNPLSIAGGSSIQGSPLHSGSSSASNAVAASLLNGLQGGQIGRDGPMASYLSGHNAQAEAMQLFLMNAGYSGYSDASTPGMVFISPSSGASVQGSQMAIPLTPSSFSQDTPAGNGLTSNAYASRGGGGSTYNNWRNGDELLFLPSSEATQQRKSLSNEAGSLNQITDLPDYALRQSSLSSVLGQQQSLLQAGHRLEMDNSHHGAGPAYQSLSLSLSNQNPQLHALESGMNSPGTQEAKRAGQAVGKLSSDLSHFRTSPRDTLTGSSYATLANNGSNKHIYFDSGPSAMSNSFSFVSGSRYLRAAQQLLDEVCSVGRGLRQGPKSRDSQGLGSPAVTSSLNKEAAMTENSVKSEITMGSSVVPSSGTGAAAISSIAPSITVESRENITVLTPEEKQEYEGKKTKLLAMLQEVDRRYRQYYDQMQVVITSFDAVAGVGAATPYTALALQAMSRYFRCLRDAITGQIQITCKALGEEDVSKSITSRPLTSRLRFIDQQIRQQRAYQQYGMLQQHAWRPQRGLPERSVSILRAWLFEHFLHPYPKDADKMSLARQTGLTRSQVSNWFINARVRLWKPMVEEMYQEEIKEHEMGTSSARLSADTDDKHNQDGVGDTTTNEKNSKNDRQDLGANLVEVENMQMDGHHYSSEYNMLSMRKSDAQLFGEAQAQMKKARLEGHESLGLLRDGRGMDVDVKPDNGDGSDPKYGSLERHYVPDHYTVPQNGPLHHPDSFESRSFGRYGNAGYASQYPGNTGVSLTLGLRHCDNLQLAGGGAQQSFLQAASQNFLAARTNHIPADNNELCNIYENAAGGLNAGHIGEHEGIDYQGRKQHMESHLLHDFVA